MIPGAHAGRSQRLGAAKGRGRESQRQYALHRLLCLCLLCAAPVTATMVKREELRVSLWLAPLLDAAPEACAESAVHDWQPVAASNMVLQILHSAGGATRLSVRNLGAAGGDSGRTPRCFQLRAGDRLLVQGAVVPGDSALSIAPRVPVLALENRSRPAPWMDLGCGWPHSHQGAMTGWRAADGHVLRCPDGPPAATR